MEDESRAADGRMPVPGAPRGRHQDAPEDLLCQIPVFGCAPSGDVCRLEDRRPDHPGIHVRPPGPMGVQRDRQIDTAPNAIEPSPVSEIAGEASRPGRVQIQAPRRLRRRERLAEGPMEFLDDPPILTRNPRYIYHKLIIARTMGVFSLQIYTHSRYSRELRLRICGARDELAEHDLPGVVLEAQAVLGI